MNTRPNLAVDDIQEALSVSFNESNSFFSVGLETGFALFNADPCELYEYRNLRHGIGATQMVGRSNFVGLVGGGRNPKFPQNRLIVWDETKPKAVCELDLRGIVLGIRMSGTRIIAVLQSTVHIWAFSSPPQKLHTFETADNPLGLVALSAKTLAFPGRTPGQVQLLNLATGNVSIIPAHTSPIAALTISPNGELLATASEVGTLIRVFSASTSQKIAELRRGADKAQIHSLSISPSSSRLAVTSDKSTLHIFELPSLSSVSNAPPARPTSSSSNHSTSPPNGGVGDNKRWSWLGRIPLLPKYFSSEWSAAQARFDGGGRGALGWVSDDAVILVTTGGKGAEARWEKFVVVEGRDGGVECVREGWRRYLDDQLSNQR